MTCFDACCDNVPFPLNLHTLMHHFPSPNQDLGFSNILMPSDPPNPRLTNIVYPASSTLPENCCLDLANASQPDLGHCLCRSKQGTAGASQALEHISRSRSTMPHKFDGARKFGLDRIQKSVVRMVERMSLVAKRLDHNLRCQCYE